MDTIFAVSSGAAPAAIAVVRASGPRALAVAELIAGSLPPPRQAALRHLREPRTGALLDRALLLIFPGPHSATGEDLVEYHLHGGRAVVAAIEAVLAAQPGLRQALPGEFTRRALESGRIDLAEAEGLGDLLLAETEGQRRAALAAAEGAVGRQVGDWNRRLLDLAARTEALLDFSDEEDVGEVGGDITGDVLALADDIALVLGNPPIERLRDGVHVVLTGAPNTGKSTLFNAMAERDAAIVSPISGTTRDRIEASIIRDGIAYVLTDTAGLAGDTDDPIERIGIERARVAIATADIVVALDATPIETACEIISIFPRCDERGRELGTPGGSLSVSAVTGVGLNSLWERVAESARDLLPRLDRLVLNARQRAHCIEAEATLREGASEADLLIVAEHLRQARSAFDHITGASNTEAMLDALFGRFCIGK